MKATKQFKMEVAHRLTSSYSVRCRSIHGHSYLMEVTLEDTELNCDGMVMDFGELKDHLNKFMDKFDHTLVMSWEDPALEQMLEMVKKFNWRFMVVDYNPTAENMASHVFNYCKELGLPVSEVRVQETKTGWATTDKVDPFIKGIVDGYNI